MNRLSILFKSIIVMLIVMIATNVTFAQTRHHKKYCKHTSGYTKKSFHKMSRSSPRYYKRKVVMVKPKKVVCVKAPKRAMACRIRPRPCYKDAVFKDQPCCKGLCDGFYVGIQGGVDSYRIRQERSAGLDPNILITSNPALNATGLLSGLYVGYGHYFNSLYYAGAEIFGNISGASTSYRTIGDEFDGNHADIYNRVSAERIFGIALLPGIKLNDDTLLYLRLGYSRAGFRTTESASVFLLASGAGARNNWVNGIAYGVGLETLICQNWSLRGEYVHTEYQSFNAPDFVMFATEGADATAIGGAYFPSENQFTLGLTYHFA